MERWLGRVALVTGASQGIGLAIATKLVKSGLVVVGAARDLDKLTAVADQLKPSGQFVPVKCDLKHEDDILSMFSLIKTRFGRLDICVNNAGLSKNSPLLSGKTSDWQEMLDVNVTAVCICSREATSLMMEKGINDGMVIVISSMSAHRVINSSPTHFYSGTKFMVKALCQGLRNELRAKNSNIRVACISPGVVETQFAPRMLGEGTSEEFYANRSHIKADDVADIAINIIQMPNNVDITDVLVRPTEQVA